MAKVKRYRPAATKASKPRQPSLPVAGFLDIGLDEIEAAAEAYKGVEDSVKEERKELTKKLDKEQAKLIEVMKRNGHTSIVIGGLSIQIIGREKVQVKGVPKLKVEREEEFKEEVRVGLQSMGVNVQKAEAAE